MAEASKPEAKSGGAAAPASGKPKKATTGSTRQFEAESKSSACARHFLGLH